MNSISCNGTLAVDLPSKSNDESKISDDENIKDEEGNFMVLSANRSFQLQMSMPRS